MTSRHSASLAVALAAALGIVGAVAAAAEPAARHVIVFVWDGLRPDSVTPDDAPRLLALAERGVTFTDHHSIYPTLTMINAGAIASGAYPGTSAFFGNTLFVPDGAATDAGGRRVDFTQPVFVEDHGVLTGLDGFYGGRLFAVPTLFDVAHSGGGAGRPLRTVTVGKAGPAFLLDHHRGGMIVDETMVWPPELAHRLQAAGLPLPLRSPNALAAGQLVLAGPNGDPTAASRPIVRLEGSSTADPTDASGTLNEAGNLYLMTVFTRYLLPVEKPDLAVIWLRNPDSTEHPYGVGSANARASIRSQDALLGQLEDALTATGRAADTDLIVLSDHGQSNVSGPTSLLPPRAVAGGRVGAPAAEAGYSVSGDVRLADLLARGGFVAYDGLGCGYDRTLSGIKADGEPVAPSVTAGADGSGCGCAWAGKPYTTTSRRVPAGNAFSPHCLIVAVNGGSDFVYAPDHDPDTVARAVRFLEAREEVGPIFVADRYGALPGTLPLSAVRLDRDGRAPDLVVGYNFDEDAEIGGVPGTSFAGSASGSNRGMHGSSSPRDVHNVMIAAGPRFRRGFRDPLPSANVDVAPTVARILGLSLASADGRALLEALAGGPPAAEYSVTSRSVEAPAATGLRMRFPTSLNGSDVDGAATTYTVSLQLKELSRAGSSYSYLDTARAVRR